MSKIDLIRLWMSCVQRPMGAVFSWAVPTWESALSIASYSRRHGLAGVVQLGAGSGYWAQKLSAFDLDVAVFETDVSNFFSTFHGRELRFTSRPFVDIVYGGPEVLQGGAYADRLLLLCYPPAESALASESLRQYGGNFVIYVGALNGGHVVSHDLPECRQPELPLGTKTGDAAFFEEVAANWFVARHIRLPSHIFCDDYVVFLERRQHLPLPEEFPPEKHTLSKPRWRADPDAEPAAMRELAGAWTLFQRQFEIYAGEHGIDYDPLVDNPAPFRGPRLGRPQSNLTVDVRVGWKANLERLAAQHPALPPAKLFEELRPHFPELTLKLLKNARKRFVKER